MKTVIVDSHSEVLSHWIREYIDHRQPLVVVRIDRHHDMFPICPLLPAREGRGIFEYLDKMMPQICEYAKRRLNEGNFTCPAFHYGIVGSVYHFDPRKERIDAYGRVQEDRFVGAPRTKKRSSSTGGTRIEFIDWDGEETKLKKQGTKRVPIPQSIGADVFSEDIKNCRYPIVICFDLDGLCSIDDADCTRKIIGLRLNRVKSLLESITSPVLAGIARSQVPRAYVPPELVDELQQAALNLMEMKGDR